MKLECIGGPLDLDAKARGLLRRDLDVRQGSDSRRSLQLPFTDCLHTATQ